MSRIAGVATGTLLASGVLFFLLKPSAQTPTEPLPSMQALASQWTDCDPSQSDDKCQQFTAELELPNNPAELQDFNLPKKPIETATQDSETAKTVDTKTVAEKPTEAASTEHSAEVKTPLALEEEILVSHKQKVTADPVLKKITEPESVTTPKEDPLSFEIESTDDLYAVDKRYSKEDATSQETVEPEWQVFWAPFQTETAAKGFAARIAKSSGVAVQVIKQDTLKYVVAFPYTNAKERTSRARAIEQAFGMKIVGQGDWT